jgi:predicted NAD-dependent protein-ADP-ribosyltransferase YbiA (DUF1768 family)
MNNTLILGSLPQTPQEIDLYLAIWEVAKEFSNIVKSPIDTANFQWNESERYQRAFDCVREADLIIGEQTKPSTGQGMEIRECAILNKPLIIVAQEKSKISWLVKWCPIVRDILYYKTTDDLKNKLRVSINKIQK